MLCTPIVSPFLLMNTFKKPKVIIHCRVSSAKQAQEGESLEVQKDILINFAEQRGWEVVKMYSESFSGWKTTRQTFKDILAYFDTHPGEVEFYVFRAIDRFTRGGTETYGLMKRELQCRGVQMVDTQGMIQESKNTLEDLGIEYDWSRYSPSEITEAVVATTSKQEITTIQTRMIGQEIRLTRKGFKVRSPQDGFKNVKIYTDEGKKRTIMEPDLDRAKYFHTMFEMRASGQWTDKQIVERLNEMGYRTRIFNRWNKNHTQLIGTSGGNVMSVKHLQELVQKPIYAGFICEYWTGNQPVKAQFNGLVTLEVFNKANRGRVYIQKTEDGYEILHDHYPDQIVLKRTRDNPMFPYKAVVVCEICGKPIMGSKSRSKSGEYIAYYHCSRKHKYVGYRKDVLETSLETYIKSLNFKPSALPSLRAVLMDRFHERQSEIVKEAISVSESVAELELQKNRAVEAFKAATSDFMREECEREAVELDGRIKKANQLGTKLGIDESDIDAFIGYTKSFIEHPADLLLDTANTRQQVSLYSRVFDTLPTMPELNAGTPKLSYILMFLEGEGDSSVLAGPVGIEPTISVLETDVIPLNYRPVLQPYQTPMW
jgi:site-specific DNA recombinase